MKPLTLVFIALFIVSARIAAAEPDALSSGRYMGGLLDHRSRYGQFWFPEPLRGPEMDVDRELRIDWFHSEKKGVQQDEVKAEVEYNFGLLTLEVAAGYDRASSSAFDAALGRTIRDVEDGASGIELSARHPIYQYVSSDGFFDYTLVAALEVAAPSGSKISKDTEIVPQLFQLLRFGEHFSLQTSVGYSALIGPNEGGASALEYSVILGYNLEHDDLPLPGVLRTIPIFELNGAWGLSREETGHNTLFGTAGVRLNFNSIGPAQPRIGIGYVFPIDQGARDELRWGIVTSLVFEF
ncbi:MAG: hypothetical protein JWN40_5345 [Phycisphaerales bacterium]|nr:hypothetical protein [Phycisphaerales bacterium]